ncbi:hypothetical protein EOM89_11335 [Candidatus Falkowbacteria bacterium]|nr:hypothetical protein [Candidatus Falkowbacteria bacterium]
MLDLHLAAAEWVQMASCPEVAAYGQLMIEAGLAIRRGDKDDDGRAIPLGRMLRLQPASGATAAPAIAKHERDTLIRKARAEVQEWREALPYTAARMLAEEFARYKAAGYAADCNRSDAGRAGQAPAAEPRGSFFRLCRLDDQPGGAFPSDRKTLVRIFEG